MIHSRPGFASRSDDSAPAKLNPDMVPALHRGKKAEAATPLQSHIDARTAAMTVKLAAAREASALAEAQMIASKIGPEILVNPAPSAEPLVLEPGK